MHHVTNVHKGCASVNKHDITPLVIAKRRNVIETGIIKKELVVNKSKLCGHLQYKQHKISINSQ